MDTVTKVAYSTQQSGMKNTTSGILSPALMKHFYTLLPRIIAMAPTISPQHLCRKFFDVVDRAQRGVLDRSQLKVISRVFGVTDNAANLQADEILSFSQDKVTTIEFI